MNLNYEKIFQRNNLIQFCYSIVLIPFWGLALLSDYIESPFILITCFLITAYSLLFLWKKYPTKKNYLFLVGPTFYFLFFIVVSFETNYLDRIFTSSLIWIYILYLFIFLVNGKLKKTYLHLIIVFFSLSCFLFYSKIHNYYIFENDIIISDYKPVVNISKSLNIYNFDFINYTGEKTKLKKSEKIIFIETWNETCIPCIKSISEMQDSLSTIHNLDHIYLYQFRGKQKFSNEQIFNFKHINDKRKILIDDNNKLMSSFEIDSYPYFLIFNSEGKLIEAYKGYKSDYKNLILSTFKQTIEKNKSIKNK